MTRRVFLASFVILIAAILIIEPAFCNIHDPQIKRASKAFIDTMKDWMPVIIGGGLVGSGICLFANNFRMGIAGLAGTGFLYAAKAFVKDGDGALISSALQLILG